MAIIGPVGMKIPVVGIAREIIRRAKTSCSSKIDVTALRIGADQFYAQFVSHVCTLPVDQQAFHVRLQYPHKSSFRCGACHDGVKRLADAAAHAHGGDPLRHAALNFSRCIFFHRAVGRDSRKLVIGIRAFLPAEHGLDQSLGYDICIAAVGSCGVGVILYGKTKVSG